MEPTNVKLDSGVNVDVAFVINSLPKPLARSLLDALEGSLCRRLLKGLTIYSMFLII
jgi:hypothetical protein